jgi:hypothetical protein
MTNPSPASLPAKKLVKLPGPHAKTLDTGDGDRATAFEAFEVLTGDVSTVMAPLFLGLLADVEVHYRRVDCVPGLLDRAAALAEATGEHASDRPIAQRVAALTSLTDQSA